MPKRMTQQAVATTISRRVLLASGLATAGGLMVAPAWGQGKKEEIAEPEQISLDTKDGVQLRATYYAGKLKKKAVPVIMIHGWGGQQDEFRPIARALQQTGHAMLTVDLRGHGLSTRQKLPSGETRDIDPEKLKGPEVEKMVLDLEACKKFLIEKNNEGELNVSALCLVAAEFGCIIALKWAVLDWAAMRLPGYKQGQDVQAIAMLSPIESLKSVTARPAMTNPLLRGRPVSKMIAVGSGSSKALAEARRMHTMFERYHGKGEGADHDLSFFTADTELQGTALLDLRAFDIGRELGKFIGGRLVTRLDDFPWEERKNPLGGK